MGRGPGQKLGNRVERSAPARRNAARDRYRVLVALLLVGLGFAAGWVSAIRWGGIGEEAERPRSPVLAETDGPVEQPEDLEVDVRDHGATGDGLTDDTAAIAAAIASAAEGAEVLFPAGTYVVNDLQIVERSGLSFVGEGERSILKRGSVPNFLTCRRCERIRISALSFDYNGGLRFGGVNFYSSKRIRIEGNRFFDSNRQPVGDADRYAIVFGRGEEPSEDVRIADNEVRDLQIEVDHARRVEIVGNTSINAVKTTAIGAFSITDGSVMEDYLIAENTIVDPFRHAITFHLDPNTNVNVLFRRIAIRDNEIRRTLPSDGEDIRLGTSDRTKPSSGNVFEDISIINNRVVVDPSAPPGSQHSTLLANSSVISNFTFVRLTIRGNRFELAGKLGSGLPAMDLRMLVDSIITDNVIVGTSNGISVNPGNRVVRNTVRGA